MDATTRAKIGEANFEELSKTAGKIYRLLIEMTDIAGDMARLSTEN